MKQVRYLKDMRGRVVRPPEYKPSGDQNPEGKAAKRRRKQMERKNPPAEAQHAADSSKPPEAVSQDLAPTWKEAGRPPVLIGDDLEREVGLAVGWAPKRT